MRELTRAEEQVMQVLWKIKKGFIKDILEHYENPKPAYTTVSTIVRILEDKGFIIHKAYGRTHEYYPAVTKEQYSRAHLKNFVRDYFSNSFENMINFFSLIFRMRKFFCKFPVIGKKKNNCSVLV